MTTRRYQLAVSLVVVMAVVVVVNGMALWGDTLAQWVDDALQLSTGLSAAVCGWVVARRVTGPQRWWRLLIAVGMFGWSCGQFVWSWHQLVENEGLPSPSLADVGYLSFPVFALPALFVLAKARHRPEDRQRWRPMQWTAHFGVAVVLDGLVVIGSLFILVWTSALAALVQATAPDALAWSVAIAYPLSDLVIVVVAVLMVVFDRVDRPYRANLLLLAAGIVALACSDSIFAYLVSIGAESMKPWSDAGFVIGPLLITYALLVMPREKRREDTRTGGVDWLQLVLPYIPVTAVVLLITGQLLFGDGPDWVEVMLSVLVIFLVLARQLLSLLDNRLLLRRVYEGQQQLAYQAYHDPLTGLANRALFAERLNHAIAEPTRQPMVLIFVDLDDFKEVNDRFGHAGGDVLLHAVGQRLLGCVRSGDMVARLGGDEFAILLEGEEEAPQAIGDRIREALRRPFAVHGTLVTVRASLGLVVPDLTEPLITPDVLLGRADTSMYAGKRLGKDTAVVYRPSHDGPPDFPTALRQAQGGIPVGFSLAYQPIVRLNDEVPVAVEALARWTAPDGTQVSPEAFVGAVEGAGLGAELDMLVLDLACREITKAELGLAVHVNVGASRLGTTALEDSIRLAVQRYRLAPGQLVVEITETVPVLDLNEGAKAIRRLQALGVRVALDDFGAGYSSLTYLHALPVDLIKLDRSLTIGGQPERDAALCRSLVGLCASLGLAVVAEGIETAEQAERIIAAGCALAQGYRFGRPGPLSASRRHVNPLVHPEG
ncbi:EAL domain-containing protein [Actinocrispum sp. NPDC049592]|uniref:putative bifunctional diguanylate cyclase/phosphodiesterase n=1 Tax=Actinocrispum sp. NPDC049592 TaxID=3154835 RepID=UPI0034246824